MPRAKINNQPKLNILQQPQRTITSLDFDTIQSLAARDLTTAQYPVYLYLQGQSFDLTSIEGIVAINKSALKELDLSGSRLDNIDELRHFEGGGGGKDAGKGLKRLAIANNLLTSFDFHFPSLLELNLTGNNLSEFPKLSLLRSLQTLRLGGNKISGSWEILTECPQLVVVDLSNNEFDWDMIMFIQQVKNLAALSNLQDINVQNNPIQEHMVYREYMLYHVPRCTYLDGLAITKEMKPTVPARWLPLADNLVCALADMVIQRDEAEADARNVKSDMENIGKDLVNTIQSAEEKVEDYNQMQTRMSNAEEQRNLAEARWEELNREKRTRDEELATKSSALNLWQQKAEKMRQELDGVNRQLQEKENELEMRNDEIAGLRGDLTSKSKDVTWWKERAQRLMQDLGKQKQATRAEEQWRETVDLLSTKLDKKRGKSKDRKGELSSLQVTSESQREEIERYQDKVNSLVETLAGTDEKVNTLTNEIKSMRAENEALKKQNEVMSNRLDSVMHESEMGKHEYHHLQKQHSTTEMKVKETSEAITQWKLKAEALGAELAARQKEMIKLSQEIARLKMSGETMSEEVANSEEKNTTLQQDLKKSREELVWWKERVERLIYELARARQGKPVSLDAADTSAVENAMSQLSPTRTGVSPGVHPDVMAARNQPEVILQARPAQSPDMAYSGGLHSAPPPSLHQMNASDATLMTPPSNQSAQYDTRRLQEDITNTFQDEANWYQGEVARWKSALASVEKWKREILDEDQSHHHPHGHGQSPGQSRVSSHTKRPPSPPATSQPWGRDDDLEQLMQQASPRTAESLHSSAPPRHMSHIAGINGNRGHANSSPNIRPKDSYAKTVHDSNPEMTRQMHSMSVDAATGTKYTPSRMHDSELYAVKADKVAHDVRKKSIIEEQKMNRFLDIVSARMSIEQ
eukprot:GFYU01004429.1.p1 GENE.GFYU01004429.1~~GFYU01004429.1.p1  ORF type:complete len:924 (+),score=301.41 GFYU01004429.1:262-3033(+)